MILEAPDTHLYPGLDGKITGLDALARLQTGCECLVEFSDGSAATARLSKPGKDWLLVTGAYRTAAGSEIGAKRWCIGFAERDGRTTFRILARAPG